MKRVMAIIFTLLLCSTAFGEVKARREIMHDIKPNGEWNTFCLDINVYAFCPIHLLKNGRLDITVQTFFDSFHYVRVMDKNQEVMSYTSVYGSGAETAETLSFSYDVTAGEYYVVVESWNDCAGDFRVMASFTESVTDDDRKDDDFQSATEYNGNKMRGFLSSHNGGGSWPDPLPERTQDFHDFYWFQSSGKNYNVNLTGMSLNGKFNCIIYDEFFNKICTKYEETIFDVELPAGRIYICINSHGSLAGDYLLRIQ